LARLDFSGAKGIVYLSSDYRIIDEDQTPTNKKGGLPACSKSTELTLKSAKPTATCHELARLTSQSARATTPVLASAQVSLAVLTFSVLATADASLDNSASIVDDVLEMKSNIIQIKNIHFSNMINKNSNLVILFQSLHLLVIFLVIVVKDRLRMAFYLLMIK
jgi:hypothetical protein